jgi:hypothetical protein
MEFREVKIEEIIVGDRVRKDYGDLTTLQVSITRNQRVLHPIGLDSKLNLVFGGRRLEAASRLGFETILACVCETWDDAKNAAIAENDENDEEGRKPFTPSEMVEMKRRLEKFDPKRNRHQDEEEETEATPDSQLPTVGSSEKPKPKRGNGKGSRKSGGGGGGKGGRGKPRRERIADVIGVSHETLRQAEIVVEAAEADPEQFEPVRQEMDRTGDIKPAFEAVQAATNPVDPIEALRTHIVTTAQALEPHVYKLCDLDRDADRPGMLERLGQFIAKAKGKKKRLTSKPADETDRYVEELFQLYPRKVGKGAAVKAIAKALVGTPFVDLKAAVQEYAEAKAGEDPQFIPHPSTWFNERRWEDDRAMWRVKSDRKPRDKMAGMKAATKPKGSEQALVSTEESDDDTLPF